MKTLSILSILTTGIILAQEVSPGWSWSNPVPHGNTLNAVTSPDPGTFVAVGSAGTIQRTTDGRDTWTIERSGVSNDRYSVTWKSQTAGSVPQNFLGSRSPAQNSGIAVGGAKVSSGLCEAS
jgi:hypothetical protein